ncbi:type I glyceraldehyde-3-phosphate dehydrogenase [Helicobacter baculiformis]|uniref:Type I glyceraldehyde-3-phosphate dehydrogenase n=1 Tax=Helicobacter baculiformis TaxID=427351 RepID=A0ABV7ZJF9_9HELI|nr:glyceraldehyde 3-phosphate dehydrogenase NAD-binding domain-containing protein [Helicobacter baculiformis]
MVRVAINGTGRIGLCAARIVAQRDDMELVALNSTCDLDTLIHLLRYDSLHKHSVRIEKVNEEGLCMGNSLFVRVLHERDPAKLDFGKAQVVLECTGKFNDHALAQVHLKNAVQRVVISAPATNTPTFVYGVNHTNYAGEPVISNASCTTNALAPLLLVLDQHFGVEHALMTTIHSYTNDQNLLDSKHKDLRRARAAALNMIPTSTGVNKALTHILPHLAPKVKGLALRVPTPVVSLIDLSVHTHQAMSLESLHASMQLASRTHLEGVLGIDNHQRVSSDFIDSSYSAIYIEDQTLVLDKHHAKILAWYDNEVGYSERLVDMAYHTMKGITC